MGSTIPESSRTSIGELCGHWRAPKTRVLQRVQQAPSKRLAPVEVAMKCYLLSHLPDDVLLRGLVVAVARENTATADVLAHIAEVDERKLYRGRFEGCVKD
jgi:hypothetical protein